MTIKVGEKGQPFRIDASFDMSGSSAMQITFTAPDGTETVLTDATTPAVTAPAVALTNDPELGTVPASEYFEVTTTAASPFTAAGTWTACGKYTDASLELYADLVTFEIKAQCSEAD